MRCWKFLRPGAVSPFTGYRWPVGGGFVPAGPGNGEPAACHLGFHACRLDDLPYWLWEELWEVELGPPVRAAGQKVVAPRARLLARVRAWDERTQREFSVACVLRTAHHAAQELETAGRAPQRELLAAALAATPAVSDVDLDGLRAAARACQDEVSRTRERQAWVLTGYVEDAIESLVECPPASLAYIAARAANQRSEIDDADPYTAERRWQRDWLAARLDLHRNDLHRTAAAGA